MKQKLVILTTHFGTNFSGGSLATCEIFSRLEHEFSEVIVVGTELGLHPFKKLTFLQYSRWLQALYFLVRIERKGTIFYGDFYNSFLYVLAGLPFCFTYHDNWPELGFTSAKERIRSFFYVPIYKRIFRKAQVVFCVSQHKLAMVSRYSHQGHLVRNGFNHRKMQPLRTSGSPEKVRILMVGTVDARKYRLALRLFEHLSMSAGSVDVYGRVADERLAAELERFDFVTLKGFQRDIPYSSYNLLLHTSVMENMPIVFCEAAFHRIPILAFDIGGSNELISYPVNGLLVKPYDLMEMKRWLEHPDEFLKAVTNDQRVLEAFSWEKSSEAYLKLLNIC